MTKNTKMLLGLAAVVGVGYYAYKKNWFKGAYKNFASDDKYSNLTAPIGCTFYEGNTGYVGMILTGWGTNGGVIVSTGNGQTLVCPRGQRYTMPTS